MGCIPANARIELLAADDNRSEVAVFHFLQKSIENPRSGFAGTGTDLLGLGAVVGANEIGIANVPLAGVRV